MLMIHILPFVPVIQYWERVIVARTFTCSLTHHIKGLKKKESKKVGDQRRERGSGCTKSCSVPRVRFDLIEVRLGLAAAAAL